MAVIKVFVNGYSFDFTRLPEGGQTSVSPKDSSATSRSQVRSPQHAYVFTKATCHGKTASSLHCKGSAFHHIPKTEGCRRVFSPLSNSLLENAPGMISSFVLDTRLHPILRIMLESSWPMTSFHASLFFSLCFFLSVDSISASLSLLRIT